MAIFLVSSSWLITILVGLITLFFVRHYLKTRDLPPGPFPLPVIGNLLSFQSRPASQVLKDFRKKYGDVFTIWLGSMPFVVVNGLARIKEGLLDRRNDFAGRPDLHTVETYLDGNISISDSDYSRPWEALRKMGHAAVRKYAVSEKLPPLVDDVTKEIVDNLLKENAPFETKDPIRLLMINIISSSIFGQRYKRYDPEFLKFQNIAETFQTEFGNGSTGDFIPLLRPFFKSEQRIKKACAAGIGLEWKKIQEHMTSYKPGVVRDVIDSLLCAGEEILKEDKEASAYLTDKSMAYMIFDLFFASIETTQIATRWILLYLANYQDVQERVIKELREKIGERIPLQEDRKKCPYTAAVITEILRIRNISPFLAHKAICNSKIGEYSIPEGTNVVFHVNTVHQDPRLWENPQRFYPDRFLENDGGYTEKRHSQFMPFGQGRRSCIGENLAIVEIFMVIAGIFRRCRITLKEPPEDMEPLDLTIFATPKDHKILFTPLEN